MYHHQIVIESFGLSQKALQKIALFVNANNEGQGGHT
jgi:hypothetical protein